MKLAKLCLTAFAVLAFPAAAHAAGAGIVPWGETFCDATGKCVTPVQKLESGPGEQWTFSWGEIRPGVTQEHVDGGWQQIYVFQRYHPNRSNHPWQTVTQLTYFPDSGGSQPVYGASFQEFPDFNTVQCGTLNYVAHMNGEPRIEGAGPGVAEDRSPLRHACFPTVFDAQGHWIPPANDPNCDEPEEDPDQDGACEGANESKPVWKPGRRGNCAAVALLPGGTATGRVAVSAARVKCSAARMFIARYLHRDKAPRGWRCRQAAVKRSFAVTCQSTSRKLRSRKIVARWRL